MKGTHAKEILNRLPVATQPTDHSPAGMMTQALANGQDLGQLEKLLDLQIRYEENEAKKAYHKAMAAFKSDPPDITKDAHVRFNTSKGQTDYKHATLANVTSKINTGLSQQGLSAAWKTEQGDKGLITVTCTITHELGHSESTSLSSSPDTTGNKNNIQAVGSTISYLQRYTILALTGLATREMDDDGQSSEPVEYVAGEELTELKELAAEVVENPEAFFKLVGAESIESIPVQNYHKAISLLRQKMAKMRQPGEGE